MLLISFVLLVVGFFFPPAWLGLVAIGISWYSSRKSRRGEAVEERVRRMVLARRHHATFPDLYFEAARAYAIEKGGGTGGEQDSASVTMVIERTPYFVVFARDLPGGGTMISLTNHDQIREDVERFANGQTERLVEDMGKQIAGLSEVEHGVPLARVHAAIEAIANGARKAPTWKNNDAIVDRVVREVLKTLTDIGITESDAKAWRAGETKEISDFIMTAAAIFEEEGFSVADQIAGTLAALRIVARS